MAGGHQVEFEVLTLSFPNIVSNYYSVIISGQHPSLTIIFLQLSPCCASASVLFLTVFERLASHVLGSRRCWF